MLSLRCVKDNKHFIQKQPPGLLWKKCVLENFANFTEKYLRWSFFLFKLQALNLCRSLFLIKLQAHRPPKQVFLSCEIFEIFNNTHFKEHLQTVASVKDWNKAKNAYYEEILPSGSVYSQKCFWGKYLFCKMHPSRNVFLLSRILLNPFF